MSESTESLSLLDDAIDVYLNDAAAIAFESFVSHEASRVAHDHYEQMLDNLPELPADASVLGARAVAWDFLAPDRSGLGARFPMRGKGALIAAKANFVLEALNRQFRWHLVAAVESLQALFRRVAAVLGFLDRGTWPARHFGAHTLDEVARLHFEWFQQSCATMKLDDVLKLVRRALPDFAAHERCNTVGRDLREWHVALSYLRHLIVHRAGELPHDWGTQLARKLGTSASGAPALTEQWKSQLARWVRARGHAVHIWLVTEDDRPDLAHARTLDIAAILEVVNGHAWLLYVDALAHFGHEMTEERKAAVIGYGTSP